MTFEHPVWLFGLVLLIPIALLEWRAVLRADRSLRLLLGKKPLPGLLVQLLPKRRVAALILRLGALALLGVGASGPQWGREAVRRQSQGSDIVFVVDVSASMEVRDVAPSRMGEARREAVGLLERLQGSRIGVVAFAGDAVRLCPLTLDHAAVRLTLDTIGPGTVSDPGSDLGRALRAAAKLLPNGHRDEQAIVLWTDGEDLEGHAREAIEELRRAGLRVFVVGVGTVAGDVIPLLDVAGVIVDVKKDVQGGVVRSRLDEGLLRELARVTRGEYFAASRSGGELVRLSRSLGALARSRQGTRLVERPVARFPLCGFLAAGLLVAFFAAPRRAIIKRSVPLDRAGERAQAALLLLLLIPGSVRAQSDWARGDAAFKRKDWSRAESLYTRRARGTRTNAALLTNLATARAQQATADSAEQQLSVLSDRDDAAGHMAGYNLGTLLGGRGDLERALAQLRRTLERDPGNTDARWNYELLQRRKREAEKQPEPKPDDQPRPGDTPESPPQDPQAGQGQPAPDDPPPPAGQDSQSTPAQTPPAPGVQQPMTKEQAERLLGSLGDLERLEKQNKRGTRAQREKKGKDW